MQVTEPGAGPSGFTAELKFVVDAGLGAQIREWARVHLAADPHGGGPWSDEYRVSSVYFDTGARDVFHRRGSFGRSKYRIRRYHQEAVAFLERKLRTGARLAKRRTSIDLTTLPLLAMPGALTPGSPPRGLGAVGGNGDGTAWFRKRVALRGLQPVCQVSYLRTARMAPTVDGPTRLTIDERITGLSSDSFTFASQLDTPLLDGQMILELKYRGRVPALFRQAIEQFRLVPRRSSKYRVAAQALGVVPAQPDETPQTLDA